MHTILRARAILSAAPEEAARDAAGLCAMVLMIFAGFMLPAIL